MDAELEIVSVPPTDSTTLKDSGRRLEPRSLIQHLTHTGSTAFSEQIKLDTHE